MDDWRRGWRWELARSCSEHGLARGARVNEDVGIGTVAGEETVASRVCCGIRGVNDCDSAVLVYRGGGVCR